MLRKMTFKILGELQKATSEAIRFAEDDGEMMQR
jgi:hypothetical protein